MARLLSCLLLGALILIAPQASASTRVELLTVGPGDAIYTRFGHTALLVTRDGEALAVYNYGLSDFERPGLFWEFLRSRSVFWVARQHLHTMVADYSADDRAVLRQPLALSPTQVRLLLRDLASDALPANREYIYHHTFENCATRPRDRLDRVLGGVMAAQLRGKATGETYRHVLRRGLASDTGILLAAELLVGRRVDRQMDRWQAVFLPQNLSRYLQHVRLADGTQLAPPPTVVRAREGADPLASDPQAGVKLLRGAAALAVVLAVFTVLLARRRSRWAGLTLGLQALPVGLCGLLVWGLCAVATLPELGESELVLVLWPTDLLLGVTAVGWLRGRWARSRLLRGYIWIRLSAVAVSLLGHAAGLLYQEPRAFVVMGAALVVSAWAAVTYSRPGSEPRPDTPGAD